MAGVGGRNISDYVVEKSFADARAAIAVLNAIAGVGNTVALAPAGGASVEADPSLGSVFEITSPSTVGAGDVDVGAAAYDGQEITLLLKTKNTQNVTVTAKLGQTIKAWGGSAVATITFDAANEFVRLKSIQGAWFVMQTSGTVA